MRLSNKIFMVWLAVMWCIFSGWLFIITKFPLNFGFVGLESIAGVILVWTMHMYKNI